MISIPKRCSCSSHQACFRYGSFISSRAAICKYSWDGNPSHLSVDKISLSICWNDIENHPNKKMFLVFLQVNQEIQGRVWTITKDWKGASQRYETIQNDFKESYLKAPSRSGTAAIASMLSICIALIGCTHIFLTPVLKRAAFLVKMVISLVSFSF